MLSAYYLMKLLEEAGLPPGVINLVPGDAAAISNVAALAPRAGRRALHGQHGRLQQHVEDDRREHVAVCYLSAHRRRDGRQGLHRRASVGRSAGARRRHRARRIRVPGAEVLGGEPRLHSALAVERRARSHRRDDGRHEDGRHHRLPQLRGRRDRREGRSRRSASISTTRSGTRRSSPAASRRATTATSSSRRSSRRTIPDYRLLCEEIFGPVVTVYVYDDDKWERDARDHRHDVAVRADRRGVRQRSRARCARR